MCDHHPHVATSAWDAAVSRRAFLRSLGIGTVAAGASTLLALPAREALAATPPTDPTGAWTWFKTDPHVHSCISGDGECDVGVISNAAKNLRYDALFLTDHQAANTGVIGAAIANHVELTESLGTKWIGYNRGSTTGVTRTMVSSPVRTGASSLRLAVTSVSTGSTCVCHQRGPTLTASGHTLTFSVRPTRVDPGCGFAVTCSIGGDARIEPPEGFTTTDNLVHPGRSIVLVWQSASLFAASSDPQSRVIATTLATAPLGVWTTYTIDVAAVVATIPAAERPLDYNAFNQVTITAVADHGSVDLNVDDFHFDATGEKSGAEDFLQRNSKIADFNTAGFKVFPSLEMGLNRHVQRFEFDLTQASQMPAFSQGIQGIVPTQQLGTPVQLNHPGLPGGTSTTDTVDNIGYGADWIECCPRPGTPRTMMDIWDAVLTQTHILGSWTSDMHRTAVLTLADRGLATYVLSPALTFNDILRSFWEGRCYLATNTFPGRVLLTTGALQTPYPARYPVWVSTASATADVRLRIDGGLSPGHTLTWTVDGATASTDHPTGASYDVTRTLTVTGARSYVRVSVQDPTGTFVAMTQPILVLPVPGLPTGHSASVERVVTADNRHYTRPECVGITAISGSASGTVVSLTHPVGAVADLAVTRPDAPASVTVDGTVVPTVSSRAALQSSSSSCWTFDASSALLTVRVVHTARSSLQVLLSNGTGDTTPPTAPGSLTATPDATAASAVLQWGASTDDVALRGYQVRRDGDLRGEFTALTYTDTGLQPATTYSWTVEAVDTSGNVSPRSNTATATTAAQSTQRTFVCSGDTYADASTGKGYPTLTKLRVDASPATASYLRFDLTGLPVNLVKATLKVRLASACPQLRVSSTSTSWTEAGLTPANAPAPGMALAVASNGNVGDWLLLDVTAGVDGNGAVAFVLTTDSTTASSLSSREGADPPVLVIDTGPATDGIPPSAPGTLSATPDPTAPTVVLGWGASTDDVAVRGYQVSRDGTLVTEVATLSYTDTALQPGTAYTWTVVAVDTSGNVSAASNPATATTASPPPVDTTPPTNPGTLTASPDPTLPAALLSWGASTDDVAVRGYQVSRDGTLVTEVATLSYTDTALQPGTAYTWTVTAVDTSGNVSTPSNTATATTAVQHAQYTYACTADTYADASTGRGYPAAVKLRIDGTPVIRSYLRFDLAGLPATIVKATLKVRLTSSCAQLTVSSVSASWTEAGLTPANAPALGATLAQATQSTSGTWLLLDVTAGVTGNGPVAFALGSDATVASSLSSREGLDPPVLLIDT
jgi:chitodextrinase